MEENTPIISFRNADIVNGEATVIYGLDLDVFPGDFVYIVGKVGTGKTSIIRTMIAENPLLKGSGTACGYKLAGIREKDIPYLRRKMGVVFQDFQLLMDRSIQDNLLFVLRATGWKSEKEMKERISSVLQSVGMELKAHKMPHQLSGGEQQRVAIARALMLSPKILCFDEPTSALDPELTGEVLKVIKELKNSDRTMIIVTHELAFARSVSDKIMFIADGVVEAFGTPEEVFDNTENEKLAAFLGGSLK